MRLPIGSPLIIRYVKIAGPKGFIKVDMILDTGAVLTVLSWSVLKAIGYDPAVTPERHEAITANGVIEVPKLRVNSISIGDAEARQIEVICHDIPELAGIRGLLGLSFLKHFTTILDYRQGYMEIS
jgi:clan AA aspartic protease (TIGR02281 family)